MIYSLIQMNDFIKDKMTLEHKLVTILSFLLGTFYIKVTYKPLVITEKGEIANNVVYCKNKGEVVC